MHGTLRTLRGTPECPKGWVRRKLYGTLRTLRGTPECPKGWVSRKPLGALRTLRGAPECPNGRAESYVEPLGHSGAPPSVLRAG